MAADYLNFGDAVRLEKLQDISKTQPDMMGGPSISVRPEGIIGSVYVVK